MEGRSQEGWVWSLLDERVGSQRRIKCQNLGEVVTDNQVGLSSCGSLFMFLLFMIRNSITAVCSVTFSCRSYFPLGLLSIILDTEEKRESEHQEETQRYTPEMFSWFGEVSFLSFSSFFDLFY